MEVALFDDDPVERVVQVTATQNELESLALLMQKASETTTSGVFCHFSCSLFGTTITFDVHRSD